MLFFFYVPACHRDLHSFPTRRSSDLVLVPGDMGRYSYVLRGTDKALAETFGSTCHGAGRLMSRTAAVKAARGRSIERELAAQGDRKSTRLNSSHRCISYAVFCLKKKK